MRAAISPLLSSLGAHCLQPLRVRVGDARRPIYQYIDTSKMKALNRETAPFFNQVEADLTATSQTNVSVQFILFKLFGLVRVPSLKPLLGSGLGVRRRAAPGFDERWRSSRRPPYSDAKVANRDTNIS